MLKLCLTFLLSHFAYVMISPKGGEIVGKRYYMPGIDELNQMIETPASKERTDRNRFVLNTAICIVSAVAAIIAAVAAVLALLA